MAARTNGRNGETGIALVSAMLFLLLGAVLVASMMSMATSERAMSSNVQVARRSLYAADAGARVMEQQLANVTRDTLNALVAANPSGVAIPNPAALFSGSTFAVNSSNPPFNATATIAFVGSNATTNSQTYDYQYTIQSDGQTGQASSRKVISTGRLRLSAARGSFTDYLVYTNHHSSSSGGAIWFTQRTSFDGRVHTNEKFRFAFNPHFGDAVSSVSHTASYYNEVGGRSNPVDLDNDHNGSLDVPEFGGGFDRGVPVVSLPSNAFSQQNVALGMGPLNTTQPNNTTVNMYLGTGAGAATPPDGVYVPNASGAVTGGIYVQGSLDQCLLTIDAAGRQVYVLRHGAATDSVIVNKTLGTTRTVIGGVASNLTGTPRGLLFVTGGINDLRGPDRSSGNVVPGIAAGTQLLICAQNDIVLGRDLTCVNYDTGTNVLGIYSAAGSVRVGTNAPNDMHLDAFVMAAGSTGQFSVDSYNNGTLRGTFHLRGGMVSEYYGAFGQFNGNTPTSGFGRDFVYDRRGAMPPYFPSTGVFTANTPTPVRESWREM